MHRLSSTIRPATKRNLSMLFRDLRILRHTEYEMRWLEGFNTNGRSQTVSTGHRGLRQSCTIPGWSTRYFASTVEMTRWSEAAEDDTTDGNGKDASVSSSEDNSSATAKNNSKDKKRRYRRRKRKVVQQKQRERRPVDETVLKQQLEDLFDEVAPLVVLNKLEAYVTNLERKHDPKQRQRMADKSSQEAAAQEDEEQENDPKNWMHFKILSFLDILPLHAKPVQTIESPATKHQKRLEETAQILKRARDKAANSEGLSWSRQKTSTNIMSRQRQKWHEEKSQLELEEEARQFAETLSTRLPHNKFNSLVRFFDDYVRLADDDKRKKISVPVNIDSKDGGENTGKNQIKKKRVVGIRILFNNVERKLGGHVHLIAPDLAKFFYFDPPDVESEYKSVAKKESKVLESEKNWEAASKNFVEKMLLLYQKIHSFEPGESNGDPTGTNLDEENDEALADIVVATLEDSSKKRQQVSRQKKAAYKPTKPHVHLLFDTVVTDQYNEMEKEYPMTSNTTVFVDNLPIDITENEVLELYSRCGPIESAEIFNRRPDLDPGALSAGKQKQLLQMSRKSRISKSRSIGGARWTRPTTPVYAILSFATEEATKAALQDPLRIFGMIVKGHSVRSIRAEEMTRLYLDNIPPIESVNNGEAKYQYRTAMDIEYSLSQLLNPDIYISLDISSSSHRKSRHSAVGSCEIMFPSFEIAYDSYYKLHEGLNIVREDESTLNWIRTPSDAMLYWTRQLGGV